MTDELMPQKERMQVIGALASWFESQDIEPREVPLILSEFSASLIGTGMTNEAAVKRLVKVLHQSMEDDAIGIFREQRRQRRRRKDV